MPGDHSRSSMTQGSPARTDSAQCRASEIKRANRETLATGTNIPSPEVWHRRPLFLRILRHTVIAENVRDEGAGGEGVIRTRRSTGGVLFSYQLSLHARAERFSMVKTGLDFRYHHTPHKRGRGRWRRWRCILPGDSVRYATALITRATLAKISSISRSLTISGGVSAMVSPVTRMTRLSALNAVSMAS